MLIIRGTCQTHVSVGFDFTVGKGISDIPLIPSSPVSYRLAPGAETGFQRPVDAELDQALGHHYLFNQSNVTLSLEDM